MTGEALTTRRRNLYDKACDALDRNVHEIPLAAQDLFLQWLWFVTPVPQSRIGFGAGPLTWARQLAHRRLKRDLHIALLQLDGSQTRLAPITAWAINNGSRRCTASVNEGLERADIIWIYTQDPLQDREAGELEDRIAACARPGTPVINPPSRYSAYHRADAFELLRNAGVSVPKHRLTKADEGVTPVVYKLLDCQGQAKVGTIYDGPREGYRAFEFVDSRDESGMYKRYRAHYLAGATRPSEAFAGPVWNVCCRTTTSVEYYFELTENERDQIRLIGETFGLHYFAVDFLRRARDGRPFFLDVNVYPTIRSPRRFVRTTGDYGFWHTFDARRRRGIPEPNRCSAWDDFDRAMVAFAEGAGVQSEAAPARNMRATG